MLRKSRLLFPAIILTFLLSIMEVEIANASLEDGFQNPPMSARPRAYWAWINGNVSLSQLTRDLEEMKDKGLSGLDIFDVGARDPQGIVPEGMAFFGRESVEAIGHTIREAGRLGLELALVTSSSWNAGGPWITPEYGSMGIFYSRTAVKGPSHFSQALPFPQVPKKSPKGPDGLPAYYKNIAVLAIPLSENNTIEDIKSVIDLSGRMERNGRLDWNAPPGDWTVLRFVCACTGESLVLPSPKSGGLIIDHFNPAATELHFRYILDKLQEEVGDLANSAMKIMYLPSYEVTSYDKDSGLVWTPNLVEEFSKRRGYDLVPYLPILFGWTVQDEDITGRFRFDFNMILSDLIIENHYMKAKEISNERGLLLCCEAGGPGQPLHNCPFEALRALGALDIPRGEFWVDHVRLDEDGNDIMWLVKEIACASHIYGKKIVDEEAFTSWYHWQKSLFDLKPLADRAMCGGANRFTLHTGAHNPPEAGKPGWVYHAGTHMNVNRVWWPKAGAFMSYLGRSCYLLQEGLFVGDVCYYYGDRAPNFVKPKHTDPSLGYGYDYDVVNTEVILTRMKANKRRIVLPDGMSYELLVLPDREDMNPEVLEKLEKLVKAGATVVGRKPTRSNGLTDYPNRDKRVRLIADRLWGSCDGKQVKERKYGKGKIVWGRRLSDILQERGIGPDFQFTGRNEETGLDYIHRRTKDTDIYYVSNRNMRWEEVDCIFRVKDKIPELWMSDSGEIKKQIVFDSIAGGTRVPLRLPPAGSVFVVFREKAKDNNVVSIKRDGRRIFPLTPGAARKNASIEVLPGEGRELELLIREKGNYTLETARGKTAAIEVETVPASMEIKGSWEVRFPAGWGAPPSKIFPQLISWTEDAEEGIKYFSGIAAYHKEFEIPENLTTGDKNLVLDLGDVRDVADVYLNGKHLGIYWKPPYRMYITQTAKPGGNRLIVEVANLWSNRLVGDAQLPQGKRYTRTNMINSLTWEKPWKKTPLLKSGLIGPVRLLAASKIKVNIPK